MNFADELREINVESEAARRRQETSQSDSQEKIDITWAKNKINKVRVAARKAARKERKELYIGKIKIYDRRYLNVRREVYGICTRPSELDIGDLKGKWHYLYKECQAIGLTVKVFLKINYTEDAIDWYEFCIAW